MASGYQPEDWLHASQPAPGWSSSHPGGGLDPAQDAHQHIVQHLKTWLANHPSPDQPALSIAQFGAYTPRELFEAVEKRSETGEFLENLILFGAGSDKDGLLGVLRSFAQESDGPVEIDRLSVETPK